MKKRDEEFLEPDLTPLIDVVFILLIFFLVTSVFKKQELAMILNLPSSESTEKSKIETKDTTIEMKDNQIVIAGKKIKLENLDTFLKDRDNKGVVHIRSDKMTRYYKVISVLDVLKRNNFTNINLVTEK